MKKISDLLKLTGFAFIIFSAGISDMAGDIKSVVQVLMIGFLTITAGKALEFISEYIALNKKVRRNKEWRRAKIKNQGYYTF